MNGISGLGRTFGNFAGTSSAPAPATTERVNAQTWLNIGYLAGDGEDAKFVSLPVGIPLDTQKALDMPRSADFAALQSARNDFLTQMQDAAGKLAPGEELIIGIDGGLCIQLRRVAGPAETPAADDSNKYAKKFSFGS